MSRLKGTGNIVSYEDHAVLRHPDGIGWDILIRMELLHPLLPPEQTAVIVFSERTAQLTQERREELAGIAAPVVGADGALGVMRLQAVANWLLGRQ